MQGTKAKRKEGGCLKIMQGGKKNKRQRTEEGRKNSKERKEGKPNCKKYERKKDVNQY